MRTDEPAPTREIPSAPLPGATRDLSVPIAPTRELPVRERPSSTATLRDLKRGSPDPFTPMAQDPISKLLRAIKEVALEGVMMVKHPRDFPERLDLNDHNLFVHGTRFLLGTVPAIFVLLLPVHMVHGRPISQTAVGFLFAGIAFFTGALMHGMLRVVGARRTPAGTTIGLYAYVVGFQGLVFIILSYPIGFKFGSKLYFGGSPEEIEAITASMTVTDQLFVVINSLLAYAVVMVFMFGGFVPMFARFYGLRKPAKTRAAVALLIPLFITGVLYQLFMQPIRKAAESL